MSQRPEQATRLRAALDRLARAEEHWVQDAQGRPARRLAASNEAQVMDALLDEVADTVMPARLTLADGQAELSLAVAGRRVQGLLSASADLLGADTDLVDRILGTEHPTAVQRLGALVRRLAEGDGPLTLRADIAPRLGAESEPGLTPDQLRAAWDVAELPNLTGLEGFLSRVEPQVRGAILRDGASVVMQVGDPTLEEPLSDVLDAAWPDFDAERSKLPSHSEPSLTCWQQTDGPVVAVAAWDDADAGRKVAALAFLPNALASVMGAWTATMKVGSPS